MARPKKKKIAYVQAGRSVQTRLGTAHEGAALSPKHFSSESMFYNALKHGLIAYPETIKKNKEKAGDTQIDLTAMEIIWKAEFDSGKDDSGKDDSGKDDSGKDDSGKDDSGEDDSGKDDSGKDDSGKDDSGGKQKDFKGGAQRKNKKK